MTDTWEDRLNHDWPDALVPDAPEPAGGPEPPDDFTTVDSTGRDRDTLHHLGYYDLDPPDRSAE